MPAPAEADTVDEELASNIAEHYNDASENHGAE